MLHVGGEVRLALGDRQLLVRRGILRSAVWSEAMLARSVDLIPAMPAKLLCGRLIACESDNENGEGIPVERGRHDARSLFHQPVCSRAQLLVVLVKQAGAARITAARKSGSARELNVVVCLKSPWRDPALRVRGARKDLDHRGRIQPPVAQAGA